MKQKEILFNNIIDSILSIDTNKHVNSPKEVTSVEFGSNVLKSIKGLEFEHVFHGLESHYFCIKITKVAGQYFWRSFNGNGSRYILSVKVVKGNGKFSFESQLGTYYYDCSNKYYLERLKSAFNHLVDRIELKRLNEEEKKLANINSKIGENINKSINRNNKLENILK